MAITTSLIKELRQRSGAGMMDCKKALVKTNGDLEAAIDLMRASGAAKAAKKSSRIAAEGVVKAALSPDKKRAILLEINSETDFVTKSNDFQKFITELTDLAINNNINNATELTALNNTDGISVADLRENLVAKIGENIAIRRLFATSIDDGVLGVYQHGNRIASVSVLDTKNEDLAKDIAMHIAASSPQYISAAEVPQAVLEHEKSIFIEQAKKSGKADNIIQKMISGKIQKFIAAITLYSQPFIKNPDLNVKKLLAQHNAQVLSFMRYEIGEGIEKQQTDFRAEVMAQAKSE